MSPVLPSGLKPYPYAHRGAHRASLSPKKGGMDICLSGLYSAGEESLSFLVEDAKPNGMPYPRQSPPRRTCSPCLPPPFVLVAPDALKNPLPAFPYVAIWSRSS